jgi:branched-chain amino acid aminotransferase
MPPAPLEPVAALNGRLVPLRQACVSVVDDGIVQGATLTERIRTFAQRSYLLEEHLQRLRRSLTSTGIADPSLADELPQIVEAVVAHNSRLLEDWQDLAIVIFVTPGPNRGLAVGIGVDCRPTVCVHTTVIPSPTWEALATTGVRLVTPDVRHVPPESIDPRIKHRSRLHWYLAEQQARRQDPQAWALLLDRQGHVTETAAGNLMVYDGSQLLTPRAEQVLGGISQQVVSRLASVAGITTVQADLSVADVLAAREAFLTSTGYCLLPVTHLNGRQIGDARPGPLAARLLRDWSAEVGVDIVAQHQMAQQQAAQQ